MFNNLVSIDQLPVHTKSIPIISPLTGKAMPLDQVPSEIFSQRLFGEGLAIEMTGSKVIAPFNGIMHQVPATAHQLRLKASNGLMMLIQIGIDSHEMMGEGFELHVRSGQPFSSGDLLLSINLQKLKKRLSRVISPVTILNSNKLTGILPHYQQVIAGQDQLMTLYI
ncbi:PTS sugar transporter subunit IIA [Neptunicella sp. SCSIO 80796]|uniref:PTS sugar transporter subunit IIA n=1 Tax=Neptunicella plasticusilytica TaxID=3117012 RepID=UPI003A4E5511